MSSPSSVLLMHEQDPTSVAPSPLVRSPSSASTNSSNSNSSVNRRGISRGIAMFRNSSSSFNTKRGLFLSKKNHPSSSLLGGRSRSKNLLLLSEMEESDADKNVIPRKQRFKRYSSKRGYGKLEDEEDGIEDEKDDPEETVGDLSRQQVLDNTITAVPIPDKKAAAAKEEDEEKETPEEEEEEEEENEDASLFWDPSSGYFDKDNETDTPTHQVVLKTNPVPQDDGNQPAVVFETFLQALNDKDKDNQREEQQETTKDSREEQEESPDMVVKGEDSRDEETQRSDEYAQEQGTTSDYQANGCWHEEDDDDDDNDKDEEDELFIKSDQGKHKATVVVANNVSTETSYQSEHEILPKSRITIVVGPTKQVCESPVPKSTNSVDDANPQDDCIILQDQVPSPQEKEHNKDAEDDGDDDNATKSTLDESVEDKSCNSPTRSMDFAHFSDDTDSQSHLSDLGVETTHLQYITKSALKKELTNNKRHVRIVKMDNEKKEEKKTENKVADFNREEKEKTVVNQAKETSQQNGKESFQNKTFETENEGQFDSLLDNLLLPIPLAWLDHKSADDDSYGDYNGDFYDESTLNSTVAQHDDCKKDSCNGPGKEKKLAVQSTPVHRTHYVIVMEPASEKKPSTQDKNSRIESADSANSVEEDLDSDNVLGLCSSSGASSPRSVFAVKDYCESEAVETSDDKGQARSMAMDVPTCNTCDECIGDDTQSIHTDDMDDSLVSDTEVVDNVESTVGGPEGEVEILKYDGYVVLVSAQTPQTEPLETEEEEEEPGPEVEVIGIGVYDNGAAEF